MHNVIILYTFTILQLKLYTEQQSIYPNIPESYKPTAVSKDTLEDVINNVTTSIPLLDPHISRIGIMIGLPIAIAIVAITVIIIALLLYTCGEKGERHYLSSHSKATIISIAFISFNKLVLFLCLDIGAVSRRDQLENLNYSAKEIYNAMNLTHNAYRIPYILLAFDIVSFISTMLIIVISTCVIPRFEFRCLQSNRLCIWKCWQKTPIQNFKYYCLSLTIIPLIFSGLCHAPYIIMAYVSDSSYASSVFVYYMVVIFIEFGLIQYTFRTYYNRSKGTVLCITLIIVTAIVFSVLMNGLMMGIFIYFFYVPIKYVLSNAPDQVVVVYHSAVLLVGAYITYKAVFYEDSKGKPNKQNHCINNWDDTKMREIETMENEITHYQCMIDENDVPNCCCNGGRRRLNQVAEDKVKFLREKIAHLRIEIQLQSLHTKFISILGSPISLTEKESIINDLYTQQYALLKYLIKKIEDYQKSTEYQEKEHITPLQVEVLTHLQNILAQFWREPHKSRRNEKFNDTIQDIINSLPDMVGDLKLIKQRLVQEFIFQRDRESDCQIKKVNEYLEDPEHMGQAQGPQQQLIQLQEKQDRIHQQFQQLQRQQQQDLEQLKEQQQQLEQQLEQQQQARHQQEQQRRATH